jgi:putative membrane protein
MKVCKLFGTSVAAAFLITSASIGVAETNRQAPAPAQDAQPAPVAADAKGDVSAGDRQIMEIMARAGVAEVEAGRLAESNAADPQVKKYARQMVEDHGKANRELEVIASRKGVTLPKEPDAEHQRILSDAKARKGAQFDRAYVEQAAVKDHAAAKQVFEDAAKNAKDPDLRSFAQKSLPVIDHHLEMAQQLHRSMQGSAAPDSRSGMMEPPAEQGPMPGA